MGKMGNKGLIMILMIVGLLIFALSCGPAKVATETPTPTVQDQNFEVNYRDIAGDNSHAKMESLVSLLNKKTKGFAKTFSYHQEFESETPGEKGTLYYYIVMVYGDPERNEQGQAAPSEEYSNKVLVIVKQLIAYTVKFVADAGEPSVVQTLVALPIGEYYTFQVLPEAVGQLKTSPTESWMSFTQTAPMVLVSEEWLSQVQAFLGQEQNK